MLMYMPWTPLTIEGIYGKRNRNVRLAYFQKLPFYRPD